MKAAIGIVAATAVAALLGCKVQHDGSFEHDAGFVAASASVAVQIGKPPTTATPSAASSSPPIGPPSATPR